MVIKVYLNITVAYNPAAVAHAVGKSLFRASVINSYVVKNGIGALPQFPHNAITIKPVYIVGHKGDALVRIPAWHGPFVSTNGDNFDAWKSYVYADVHNKQPSGKKLIPVTDAKPTKAQIAAATCNLTDFINFKLDTALAAYINQQQGVVQGIAAQKGDIALLVAMHVSTKEIHNWTWQTFYWAPNPEVPLQPSSVVAANLRPAGLVGAAKHYAMAAGYAEVSPNQPFSGGKNKGVKPIFVYNPYLESPFGPGSFGVTNKLDKKFQFGIQTNCMSCHAIAKSGLLPQTPYTTDQYINMKEDSLFKNKVQFDFAWSIQSGLINDTSKTKKK